VLAMLQVIERLTERRIVVEKAVSTLGEAPQGLRDVFELCRGFEKAFSNVVNVSSTGTCKQQCSSLTNFTERLHSPVDTLLSKSFTNAVALCTT